MASFGFNTSGQFTVNGNAVKYGQNYIINGGFDYWNYATSQTTSGYGSDDRWNNIHSGSTKTHSMVNATDTERVLFNSSKFSRTVVTSATGVGNRVIKSQPIEDVTKLAGKTVTVSFWAKADSVKNIAIEFTQIFGTGGSPSAGMQSIGSQLVSLTSTWQKKTITVVIPSIVGKTLGTDGVHTSSTALLFWFDAGSDYNTRTASLGQQSGTFDIAEVKLEEGSVATPWTPYEGEFGGEIQACQRYYWKTYSSNTIAGTATYIGAVMMFSLQANRPICSYLFATKMRTPPSIVWYGTTGVAGKVTDVSNSTDISVTTNQISDNSVNGFAAGTLSTQGGLTHIVASAEL